MKGILLDVVASPFEDLLYAMRGKTIAYFIVCIVVWVIAAIIGIIIVIRGKKKEKEREETFVPTNQGDENTWE